MAYNRCFVRLLYIRMHACKLKCDEKNGGCLDCEIRAKIQKLLDGYYEEVMFESGIELAESGSPSVP